MHRLFVTVIALILAGSVHAQTPPPVIGPPPPPRPQTDPTPLFQKLTPETIKAANAPLPATAFLGNFPPKFRTWTQKQWRAMPILLRLTKPPGFRIATGNEIKKIAGITREAAGVLDINAGIVYTRSDNYGYHEGASGHEMYHRLYYLGYYPGRLEPILMNWKQKMDWRAWVQGTTFEPPSRLYPKGRELQNYKLIPQYTSDVMNGKIMDRELDHEKYAQAGAVYSAPGGVHPWYGRCNPLVAEKLKPLVGTSEALPAWAVYP